MSTAAARRLARRARRWGYYKNGPELRIRCPLCDEWIRAETSIWDKGSDVKALDSAVIEHLQHDCRLQK